MSPFSIAASLKVSPCAASASIKIETFGDSACTVRNLVGIAGKPHASTVVAVIGPQTAQAAQEHGLRVDVQAESPNSTSASITG